MVEIILQPYQYAYDNPVMFNDPTGMRGEMKVGWPPKWWKNLFGSGNEIDDRNIKTTDIEEVVLYGKRKKRFSERTAEWSQIHIREPLSHWFDVHTREPARKFTKPLRDAFEWTPERTAAYHQFMVDNGVEYEKDVLNGVMKDYGAFYGADIALPAISKSISSSFKVGEAADLTGGAARAATYSDSWATGKLSEAIDKFAPGVKGIKNSKGKTIYKNVETGIQVVYDNNGNYFRIQDTNLSGNRNYLNFDGIVPNNKVINGKQAGRNQSEYNQVTHFKNH